MPLSPAAIESLCDYADMQRADGVTWDGIMARLQAADRKGQMAEVTLGQLKGWHALSQQRKLREKLRKEKRESGLEVLDGPAGLEAAAGVATASGWEGSGEAAEAAREGEVVWGQPQAVELIRYLGGDLVGAGRPRWQYAQQRVLKPGEYWTKHAGPGEVTEAVCGRPGVRWLKAAVCVWIQPAEGMPVLVDFYGEHRVWAELKPQPPRRMNLTLQMQVFALEGIPQAKALAQLVEVEARLKQRGRTMPERERERLERMKRRLEIKVALTGDGAAVTALRVQEMLSKLATLIDMHCPELTGAGSGAALARSMGRTRAAQSAARISLQKELAERNGGRAGYRGMKKRKK